MKPQEILQQLMMQSMDMMVSAVTNLNYNPNCDYRGQRRGLDYSGPKLHGESLVVSHGMPKADAMDMMVSTVTNLNYNPNCD